MTTPDPAATSFERMLADVESRLNDPRRLNAVQATLERPVPVLVHALIRALAADLDASFAAVTVLDKDTQHFLSTNVGDVASCKVGDTGCQYVISTGQTIALHTGKGPSWVTKMLSSWTLREPSQAYLGVPLMSKSGEVLGAICVIDSKPRSWKAEEHYTVYEASKMISQIIG